MGKNKQTSHKYQRRDRRLRIRSIKRNPPDLKKLAGALIELAEAQAEADALAEHARKQASRQRKADRAERLREQADNETARRPRDNRPGGHPPSGVVYDRQDDALQSQVDGADRSDRDAAGGRA